MPRKQRDEPFDEGALGSDVEDPQPAAQSSIEELFRAALRRGDRSLETGRYLVTCKEGAIESGTEALRDQGFRVADARDFDEQSVRMETLGDAEVVTFPEVGVMLLSGASVRERALSIESVASDERIETVEPEYFVFTHDDRTGYLLGFARAAEIIARDLGRLPEIDVQDTELEAQAFGATWGLIKCRVPQSSQSGAGIDVAVLDTGMDLGHPDFAGRTFVSQSFVEEPVQDLHGHGTHCIGTACGPQAPGGSVSRYGIAYRSRIFVGKVLTNSGIGAGGSIIAGMNWAIAKGCAVISMSLGGQSPVQAAYTTAGTQALNKGCLIIAAAGNKAMQTGAPANSLSIMAVASLDPTLTPSSFSNYGKIDIAAPGRDVFSSAPRPTDHIFKSGTSMATPHVAGCAALWAASASNLRGVSLWRKLCSSARKLPLPPARVGCGLVQAP